jgi:hypothetical protein
MRFTTAGKSEGQAVEYRGGPSPRTASIYFVWTTAKDAMDAARVGHGLAMAMGVPLTLVQFRPMPAFVIADAANNSVGPETLVCLERLRLEGIEPRVRLYLCPGDRRTLPFAFPPRSLIVMGGQRSWWPTQSERWRRCLESAGHYVVFVDTTPRKEGSRA